MSENNLQSTRERMEKSVQHTRDEMVHIRTGKATPVLLDGIKVDYYGSNTPLKQLANIAAPEARLLVVHPFDKNTIGLIEKAILGSDIGLTPQNDGRVIRLPIPILTAERREELIKVVRRIAEEGRVSIRNTRRDSNEQIKKSEKSSDISEDESRRLMEQIQKETDKQISEIDNLLKVREEEIREE